MTTRTKKPEAYTALDSAVGQIDGKDYMIVRGKRYSATHPMVLHAPELFEDAEPLDYEDATTEQRTR